MKINMPMLILFLDIPATSHLLNFPKNLQDTHKENSFPAKNLFINSFQAYVKFQLCKRQKD